MWTHTLLRFLLFCAIVILFCVQQTSLVLILQKKTDTNKHEWLSISFFVILLPYGLSFLAEVWNSSFSTGGRWREWPHWGSVLLGSIASTAESYMTTCLFYNLLPKLPGYMTPGVINSVLLFNLISANLKNETKRFQRYLNNVLILIFTACIIGSGVLLSLTDYLSAKDSIISSIFLLLISIIISPKFQSYIHSTEGIGKQNSSILYLFLKMITFLLTMYLLNRTESLLASESLKHFFSSFEIPDKTNLWLTLVLILSTFLCTTVRYFRTNSTRSKVNVDFPIYLSLFVVTVFLVLVICSLVSVSILDFMNSKLTHCTPPRLDSALYLIAGALIIIPTILTFITVNQNELCNVFSSIFCPQFLLCGWNQHYKKQGETSHKPRPQKRRIFICTTMYQESTLEMDRLLASVKAVSNSEKLRNENIFLESHIFLDNGCSGQNIKQFGLQLLGLVEEILVGDNDQGVMLYTPYGIQLVWRLDNGMPLFIHLKDKEKVKAKKRWSQVMYMKYVLNYRSSNFRTSFDQLSKHSSRASLLSVDSVENLFEKSPKLQKSLTVPDLTSSSKSKSMMVNGHVDSEIQSVETEMTTVPYVEIFVGDTSSLDNLSVKHGVQNSIHTVDTHDMTLDDFEFDCNDFILATDADMTFNEESILDVLRMCEADKDVGAVCGRTRPKGVHIHPIVWLQMFDYAKDFWIIKSSQNVIGSVMCCPGCFSLYKLDAVRDVVDDYSGPVETMEDVFTKDNGEDRWMCTLMMLKGWKLRYSSNARNTTFCPEDTSEFMKQRRRWLLSDYANAVLVMRKLRDLLTGNDAFSVLYVLYIIQLFLIMLLYPGSTIVMLCLGLELSTGAPLVIVTPVIGAVVIAYCLMLLSECSHAVEQVITKILIMVFGAGTVYIFVSSTTIIFNDLIKGFEIGHFEHAEGFLVMIVLGSYIYGALLYPTDVWILVTGLVYLFFIPFMNMILPLYAICNIVDQTWGTRDNQKASVPKFLQLPKIKRKMKKRRKSQPVDTASLHSLSASSLSISDYNQSEYEFWDDLVTCTVGVAVSKGIADDDRKIGLQKLRKKALIFFLSANFICIVVLVGFYAFLMQTFSNKSTFSIVMGITLGLSPLIQISGSTVYRIDDVMTRVGRWVSET